MPFVDIVKLAFDNNLILGHCPEVLPLEEVGKKFEVDKRDQEDIQSFGLFDSNQSNYNTYYPQVSAEDLQPKESEFIEPVFRALSEVIVHKKINPIDFSENSALKKSMHLLRGATINADHEMAIGNAMGAVSHVAWQEASKTPSGLVIPAGINAKLKIDGKSHPRVARAIMMDPPAIHSTSVTVEFQFDKSHVNLTDDEFWAKLGTFDKDGKLIRRVVNKVVRYHEISLVHHGADPYAQKIKDGQINNPLFADVSYNSAHPKAKPATKFFFMDFKTDLISNEEESTIPEETNDNETSQNTDMNKKFLIALAMVLGLKNKVGDKEVDYTEDTITEEVVQNSITALAAERIELQKRPEGITAEEVTRLKEIETQYEAIKDVAPLKAFKDARTTKLREKTIANFTKLKDGNPPKEMVEVLNTASFETLEVLNQQYEGDLEQKFPLSCKDCNSTNINRGSAALSNPTEGPSNDSKKKGALGIKETLSVKRSKGAFKHMHEPVKVEDTK